MNILTAVCDDDDDDDGGDGDGDGDDEDYDDDAFWPTTTAAAADVAIAMHTMMMMNRTIKVPMMTIILTMDNDHVLSAGQRVRYGYLLDLALTGKSRHNDLYLNAYFHLDGTAVVLLITHSRSSGMHSLALRSTNWRRWRCSQFSLR
jgi:hypothetical protein